MNKQEIFKFKPNAVQKLVMEEIKKGKRVIFCKAGHHDMNITRMALLKGIHTKISGGKDKEQ